MEAFIERRQASRAPAATDAALPPAPLPAPPTCLGRVLEQIDDGTVLVDALGHVRFLDGAGRRALHGDGPLPPHADGHVDAPMAAERVIDERLTHQDLESGGWPRLDGGRLVVKAVLPARW